MAKNPTFPKLPNFSLGHAPHLRQTNTLNPDGFQQILEQQGVPMVVARAVPCANMKDLEGVSHPPKCEFCLNGYRYYGAQKFIGAFTSNNSSMNFESQGSILVDMAQVIIPNEDAQGRPLNLNYFDRIQVEGTDARYWQRVQHNQSGIDRLQFPAKSVELLYDNEREYVYGVDFQISPKGFIEWIGDKRPGYDPMLDQGGIYSVVYYASAVYTVVSIPSAITTVQVQGPAGPGTENTQKRLPYMVTARREFIAHNSKLGINDKLQPPEPQDE